MKSGKKKKTKQNPLLDDHIISITQTGRTPQN